MNVIELAGVTKRYGRTEAVRGIDFEVRAGEVYGFIGPNGAGKSSTIRMIMQLIRPTSGEIRLFGEPVAADRPTLRRRIGYLPSEVAYFPELTGRRLLDLVAGVWGMPLKATPAFEFAERLKLDLDKSVKSYSLGNRKKLGIIQCLLHRPELLILDEPTSGLDPLIQHEVFELLRSLSERGATVFFSTHVLSEVEKLCRRVSLIREGRIIRTGGVAELLGGQRSLLNVTFDEPGDRIGAYRLKELDEDARFEDGVHHLRVAGSWDKVLGRLAELPVADLQVRRPALEELFMDFYEAKGDGVK